MNALAYYQGIPFDQPVVRFYALCILVGACLAWYLSSLRAHKEGHSMDFFSTVFFCAFPLGIVGARIWYVIASFQSEFLPTFQSSGFWAGIGKCLAIWNGGLAIQGGALLGIISGVIFVACRRRGTSVLQIMDFAVPTILVAQAVGRWGNFFNQEVFGHAVSLEAWNFLPSFITNNMQNGSSAMLSGVTLPADSIAAPLFLVEGVINLIFYFLLTQGIPAVEGKHYCIGDQSFGYFIAYGVCRLILEPLRNPAFIMGTSSASSDHSAYKSSGMAIAFIVIGVVLIVLNHVLSYLTKKGKFDKLPFMRPIFVPDEGSLTVSVSASASKEKETALPKIHEGAPVESTEEKQDELSRLKALEESMKNQDKE